MPDIFSFFLFFFNDFFYVDQFLKSLFNLLKYCFCFLFWLFWPGGRWDLSRPARDQIRSPLHRKANFCCSCLIFTYWLHWVFVAARTSSGFGERGLLSSCACGLLTVMTSLATKHRLWCARAQLPYSTWDLPGPGIEQMFLALQGEFLTTGPPGKPRRQSVNHWTTRDVPWNLSFNWKFKDSPNSS